MGHQFRDLKLSPHVRTVSLGPGCNTLTKINGINQKLFLGKTHTHTSWAVTKGNPESIEHVASHILFKVFLPLLVWGTSLNKCLTT